MIYPPKYNPADDLGQAMKSRFYMVDVFAERPYAGNQLAVVVNADDLSASVRFSFAF